jgi:hypothetical protein
MVRVFASLSIAVLVVTAGCGRAGLVSRAQHASAPRLTAPAPDVTVSPPAPAAPTAPSNSQGGGGTTSPSVDESAPCTGVALSASPASPQPLLTPVTWTAVAAGCSRPVFRFFWTNYSGAGVLVQPWSSTNTYSWATYPGPPGANVFQVDVRHDLSSDDSEASASQSFDLTYGNSGTPCTSASLDGPSQATVELGTEIWLRPSATGCPHPEFRFTSDLPGFPGPIWEYYPVSAGPYQTRTSDPAGSYSLKLEAREAGDGPVQATTSISYTLVEPCIGAKLVASPPAPQPAGTTVTFTASTTTCTNPEYRFWYFVGTSGTIQQDWSSNASTTVQTSSSTPSTFTISVDIRQAGIWTCFTCVEYSTQIDYNLGSGPAPSPSPPPPSPSPTPVAPCTGVSATVQPPSPQPVQTANTWTATATGCSNPQFQFWVISPDGVGTLRQGWSSSNTYTDSGEFTAGDYTVKVYVMNAGSDPTTCSPVCADASASYTYTYT